MNDLINTAVIAGSKKLSMESACISTGGHYKDCEIQVNHKDGWKCRCGFTAIKKALIWSNFKIGEKVIYSRLKSGGYFDKNYKATVIGFTPKRIRIEYQKGITAVDKSQLSKIIENS